MKPSHKYRSQRKPNHIIQAAQTIIKFHPQNMLKHVNSSGIYFFEWNFQPKTPFSPPYTKSAQLAKQKSTPSPAEGPESLDIMRKSMAKPIIPPAAHQCPRKAAIVGNGKQHILKAILSTTTTRGCKLAFVGETRLKWECWFIKKWLKHVT